MRCLYFDIDGTLLGLDSGIPKPALAEGGFEAAVRRAHIDRLVCVGNFCRVVQTVQAVNPAYDGLGAIFALCRGAFVDEEWFRSVTTLIADPENRGGAIDFSGDWWYVDDLAEQFFGRAGLHELYRDQTGRRILAPQPDGTGDDVLSWLAGMPT